MTSPPLRVPVSPLEPGEGVLDEESSTYAVRVHRLRPGDVFHAFDPEARREATATLLSTDPRSARIRVAEVRVAPRLPGPEITLVQSLAKADRVDQVVRDATALGVARLWVATTERSMRAERALGRRERWKRIAIQAARQSGRGDLPELLGPDPLADVLSRQQGTRLLLAPNADQRFADALTRWDADSPLSVVVGPEGGLSAGEIGAAVATGFVAVRLGPLVLRTETAATAVLGAVLTRFAK